jgi:hypothetical protein
MIKGMCKTYSRCGKTCDERFSNVKTDKAFMLLGEKPKEVVENRIEKKKKGSLQEVIKSIETHRERMSTVNIKNLSPVFLAQGRDEYYDSVRNRDKVPPCGYYNIENQKLKYCKSIPNFNKKHKSKSKVPREPLDLPFYDTGVTSRPSTQYFKLQLPRQGLEKMSLDVNEKRFQSTLPIPSIFSKSKKIVSPNFSIGKGHNLSLPEAKNSTIYNSNYDLTWKDTTKPLLEFEKYTPRKPNMASITDVDYTKKSFTQIDKSVPSVYIDKNTSRPSSNMLPAFMVVRNI